MSSVRAGIREAVCAATAEVDGWLRCRHQFPATFAGFAGHFPGNPVLPAVVQVLMAQDLLERHLGRPCRAVALDNAKFRQQLGPDQAVDVALRPHPRKGPGVYEVQVSGVDGVAASFTLAVSPGEATP